MIHTEYANTAPQNQGNIIHTVLVVDDVKAIATKLQATLPADKFRVVSATRAHEVLQLLEKEPLPTVIVLDIYLPEDGKLKGGVQLARKIREKAALKVPIIAYSNYAYWIEKKEGEKEYATIRREMHKIGIYDFIDKNMTVEGEPNPGSINTLAVLIQQIADRLKRSQGK